MSEKRETEGSFPAPYPPRSLVGRPQERAEIDRFIWIGKVDLSPPKKLVSFQTKWQMSPSICCLQSGVHSAPSARMMDLIMAGSLRFTIAEKLTALRATKHPQQDCICNPAVVSNTQMLFPAPRKMANKVDRNCTCAQRKNRCGKKERKRHKHLRPGGNSPSFSVSALRHQIDVVCTLKVFCNFHGIQGRCQDQNILNLWLLPSSTV